MLLAVVGFYSRRIDVFYWSMYAISFLMYYSRSREDKLFVTKEGRDVISLAVDVAMVMLKCQESNPTLDNIITFIHRYLPEIELTRVIQTADIVLLFI